MNNRKQVLNSYVGLFSGLGFFRKQARAIMKEEGAGGMDIISVQQLCKGDPRITHEVAFKKKIRKGHNTITVDKVHYFAFKITKHNAYRLSIKPMPTRIWDEEGYDWWIPQTCREEYYEMLRKKKGGKR